MLSQRILQTITCFGVVILEFDGSFRPPRDPGFPTLAAKMATCASTLSIFNSTTGDRYPLCVGSSLLPVNPETTSAHPEYSGMLLGLEWLCNNDSLKERILNSHSFSDDQRVTVRVQGDCKAVIDQLSGKSIPRKLQSLHSRASVLVEQLQEQFDVVEFQHIPRNQNQVCDNICANLMEIVAGLELQRCLSELELISSKTIGGSTPATQNKRAKTKVQPSELEILRRQYLQSDTRSRIKYSLRPPLYQKIASIAYMNDNFRLLVQIGEQQASESVKDKLLLARGVQNQMIGWRGLNMEKKALFLERKYRVLLAATKEDQHNSVGDFKSLFVAHDQSSITWDAAIGEQWADVLEKWRTKAFVTVVWKEGSSLWVDAAE